MAEKNPIPAIKHLDPKTLEVEQLDKETIAQIKKLNSMQREIMLGMNKDAKFIGEARRLERKLGRIFLDAAERGHAARIAAFMKARFPATYEDPESGETALHIIAANGARKSLRAMLSSPGRVGYLHRDKQGRLPSELAYLYGDDPAMARLLAAYEKKTASFGSGRVTRRPPPKEA